MIHAEHSIKFRSWGGVAGSAIAESAAPAAKVSRDVTCCNSLSSERPGPHCFRARRKKGLKVETDSTIV